MTKYTATVILTVDSSLPGYSVCVEHFEHTKAGRIKGNGQVFMWQPWPAVLAAINPPSDVRVIVRAAL